MAVYDVLIIGGGIGGLFTAWRLAASTNLRIAVLEYDSRFGGRFQTCIMPGDFPADLGAMRFVPSKHPLLTRLIKELELTTEKFFDGHVAENIHRDYFKNCHVNGLEELKDVYSIREQDLPYFPPAQHPVPLKFPPNGNFFEAEVGSTGQLARDMSQSQYLSLSMNPEVLNRAEVMYPVIQTMANVEARKNQFRQTRDQDDTHYCVAQGMEQIIQALVGKLKKLPNVLLATNSPVNRIDEAEVFTVHTDKPEETLIRAKKIILACNARGIELISWNSPKNRTTQLQKLFGKVIRLPCLKLFLTYKCSWWEEAGLRCGSLYTDLPISAVMSFGKRGKNEQYATLLASYTFKRLEIFEGLNQPSYKKFENSCGDVPGELVPSQLLVDYVQKQLKLIFGMTDIPSPVCAAVRIYGSDPIDAGTIETKVGVDANQLQWEGMKPFPDADVYITGDTFVACTKKSVYTGWAEGVLMNSERILIHHFDQSPYLPDHQIDSEDPM